VTSVKYALRRLFHTLWKSLITLVVICNVYVVFPYAAGVVHGRVAPVVKYPAYITEIQPINLSSVMIWGHSERLQDCDFAKLQWYLGGRNQQSVQVGAKFFEAPKNRPVASFEFGPWSIEVPPKDLFENSYADVKHCNCRVKLIGSEVTLPWCVWSKFY
jgi:hypothetical protein